MKLKPKVHMLRARTPHGLYDFLRISSAGRERWVVYWHPVCELWAEWIATAPLHEARMTAGHHADLVTTPMLGWPADGELPCS